MDRVVVSCRRKKANVFTLLVLAADNLQKLFTGTGTSVDIPELDEMAITAALKSDFISAELTVTEL